MITAMVFGAFSAWTELLHYPNARASGVYDLRAVNPVSRRDDPSRMDARAHRRGHLTLRPSHDSPEAGWIHLAISHTSMTIMARGVEGAAGWGRPIWCRGSGTTPRGGKVRITGEALVAGHIDGLTTRSEFLSNTLDGGGVVSSQSFPAVESISRRDQPRVLLGSVDAIRSRPVEIRAIGPKGEDAMRSDNPSWILVEGSDAATIQRAVVKHSGIAAHEQPQTHRVTVFGLGAGRFAVTFDPPAPPYAFANLIGWLDDPHMCRGARRAVGWLVAPGDGTRYFLAPQQANTGGDTLVGAAASGERVSVFLPDCSIRRRVARVEAVAEPELPAADAEPLVTFEVTLDGDASFGNPQFMVE